MTFTFATDLSTDLAKVRFHIGDTSEDGAYLADETINALITSEGSVGGAAVASIKYILTQLSKPNFRKDWLSVDYEEARKGYNDLLKKKAREFGVTLGGSFASSVNPMYRADSGQYTSSDRETTTDENTTIYDGTP